jgi:hypothetical protein
VTGPDLVFPDLFSNPCAGLMALMFGYGSSGALAMSWPLPSMHQLLGAEK